MDYLAIERDTHAVRGVSDIDARSLQSRRNIAADRLMQPLADRDRQTNPAARVRECVRGKRGRQRLGSE